MNSTLAAKLGPLAWVKPEIDFALERLRSSLDEYFRAPAQNEAVLAAAMASLREVTGALQIIGMEALGRLSREIEDLLAALSQHSLDPAPALNEILIRATNALADCLVELVSGEQDRSMCLLPILGQLARARGAEAVEERSLFCPDLNRCPPPHPEGEPLNGQALSSLLKAQRSAFQRGMLSWLRQSDDGLNVMRNAIQQIERAQPHPRNRVQWWVAVAFFDGLLHSAIPPTDEIKRLAGRLDRYLADFASGAGSSEVLMREMLFHLARCGPVSPLVCEVRSLFELDQFAEPSDVSALVDVGSARAEPLPHEVRDILLSAKAEWAEFRSGQKATLLGFRETVAKLERLTTELGSQPISDLFELMHRVALELRSHDFDANAAMTMELEGALIAAEKTLEGFTSLTPRAVTGIAAIRDRLQRALTGIPAFAETSGGMPNNAVASSENDVNAISDLSREMLASLRQVEEALEAYFRGQAEANSLTPLIAPMRNVVGALEMLGTDAAAQIMEGSASIVDGLAQSDRRASSEEVTLLAEGLSSVMLFIQALDHGNSEELHALETILARFKARDALLASLPLQEGDSPHSDAIESERIAAHAESAKQPPDLESSKVAVGGEDVSDDEIAAILDHFDLTALQDEGAEHSGDSGSSDDDYADQPLAGCVPDSNVARTLASQTNVGEVDLSATSISLDPEIVSIFIEEAHAILDAMGDLIARVRAKPDDCESLSTLRRGFHTLKGSGRMAGLIAIGDAAWTIESLLNSWLDAGRPVSERLVATVDLARELLAEWIAHVRQYGREQVRTAELEILAKKAAVEFHAPIEKASSVVSVTLVPPRAGAPVQPIEELPAQPPDQSVNVGSVALPTAIFEIFLEEARQNLAVLQKSLAALEAIPDASALEEFRRAAHTLGGIARTAGVSDVSLLAGALEDISLGGAERGRALAVSALAIDVLTALVSNVGSGTMSTSPDGRFAHVLKEAASLRHVFGRNVLTPTLPRLAFPEESVQAPGVDEVPLTYGAVKPTALKVSEIETAAEESADVRCEPERRVLKDDIDVQLAPVFLDEVRELVPLIGDDLRRLRNSPTDAAALNSLRRVFHTIKGAARMVGAMRLGELVHLMEGRLDVASKENGVTAEILEKLEDEFDRLTIGFDTLERGVSSLTPQAVSNPEASVSLPAAAEGGPEFELPSFASQVRVAADTLDRLLNQAGEISISRGRIEAEVQTLKHFLLELADSVTRLRGQMREIEIQAESRLQATLNQATEHESVFDPLEFDRFTRFQELTRLMAESLHDVTAVQRNLIESLDEMQGALGAQSRLNRSLQDDLLRLRTVPFHHVGERLYRVARQAVRETGKQARFEVLGSQTGIDRGVLERIAAPLEHLVRNAVVHGIETPDHRIRNGKQEVGSIRLTLRQETNDLLILLSDDGQGIDHERIRSKAVELGLISAGAQLTPAELEQLIFRGGFSTASGVTELAGRGVGMDVVASEVHALGGRLEISTAIGTGTTFAIRVPLNMAVAKAVVVSAAERRWVILSGLVEQVQEVPASALAELHSRREIDWMAHRYPLFYLPELLGEGIAPAPDRLKHYAVLIRSGDRRVGVIVDQLTVNQDVVLKKLGPQIAHMGGVGGATVLPNGEVALILDPAALADGAHVRNGNLSKAREEHSNLAPLVMVVDDSPTVRKVTGRLLARNEFRVATARDGLDALDQIQETMPDVLLVDIEMPRMDGFDLTKNLKSSPQTAHIPIIMITSRLAPKHREYAQQLGVDVYLGKPYEERELLGHIGRFTASAAAA